MSVIVSILPAPRLRAWAVLLSCAAFLGCGGLAEDGRRSIASSPSDPDLNGTSTRQRAEPVDPAEQEEEKQKEQVKEPRGPGGVGAACGQLDTSPEGVAVGTVELRRDPLCGASSWCLTRAPPTHDCRGSLRSEADGCTADDFVAVPPSLAPEPEWQEDTCTCRCDGEARDVDYCACPQGMRCESLIPSAGVNSAARPFIGSYCVY